MKKLLILLSTTLLYGTMWGQCPTGNLYFYTQSDIDNFTANYPGCTQIQGSIVMDNTDIVNLNGLSQITTIGGKLEMTLNTYMTDISGLSNLQSVGGDLVIDFMTQLVNLEGLESLTSVGQNLSIKFNSALSSMTGFDNLTSVGNNINIEDNYNLTDLAALSSISHVSGSLWISDSYGFSNWTDLTNLTAVDGNFTIKSNIGLTNIDGLENLTTVGGNLNIESNLDLINLDGLANLNTIGGNLNIYDNVKLLSVEGLANLTAINGELIIEYNYVLPDLNGLENIDPTTITNLKIRSNDELILCGVSSVCDYLAAGGTATISNNAFGCNTQAEVENTCAGGSICPPGNVTISTQQEIDDFPINYPGCTVISGNLIITESFTDPITNLNGLSQIEMITGNFIIGDYVNVPDLTAFNNLTSVGGNLSFDNSRINSLDGLENLSSVGGNLTFEGNALLTDISGLSGLTSIGGHLTIVNNNNLSNLIGLENLTVIGGILNISNNDALSTLSAIDGLDHTSIIYLIIENNTNLSVCSVTSICNYLAVGGPPSSIFNNASNCNTQVEVETFCNDPCVATPLMSVNDQPISDGIYQAANEVNSIGTVPIGGNVNFKAGQIILLDHNFTVEPNADFSAEIEDCGQ